MLHPRSNQNVLHTLTEPSCQATLIRILNAKNLKKFVSSYEINMMRNMMLMSDGKGVCHTSIDYYWGKNMNWGRRFAKSGYQRCGKRIRRLLSEKYLKDLDMVNCFPTIVAGWCDKLGIECQFLKHYNSNRDDMIREITDLNPDVTKDMVKQWFLSLLHMGDLRSISQISVAVSRLRGIYPELDKMQAEKIAKDMYKHGKIDALVGFKIKYSKFKA